MDSEFRRYRDHSPDGRYLGQNKSACLLWVDREDDTAGMFHTATSPESTS
jgi:hypothetical protein